MDAGYGSACDRYLSQVPAQPLEYSLLPPPCPLTDLPGAQTWFISTHIKSPPHKLRSISCGNDFSMIFHPFFSRLEAFEIPSSWLQTDPLFAKIGHFVAELWQDLCFGRGWRAYSRYLGFGWVLPYMLVSIICYHLMFSPYLFRFLIVSLRS
ncbi:uncharacterized protein EV420DRAFT_680261 [Desarmillaria tabescens]|uniref:Uncharacterized protein n=1 Tax=Armillaria tabescens TaxID=1929756 RepID=A0AA39K1D0_ARMTA|nr:uncharacterized protein EV420DRAFT_680261 [Desarmillaria tabescens]KAK0452725.1 hypothetical protein EV420DRAFT_680261 [Desarmillaria tabescens]